MADASADKYLKWLAAQLRTNDTALVQVVIKSLMSLLRFDSYRLKFYNETDGVEGLNGLVDAKAANFQMQYQVIFCYWLLTFNADIAGDIPKYVRRRGGGGGIPKYVKGAYQLVLPDFCSGETGELKSFATVCFLTFLGFFIDEQETHPGCDWRDPVKNQQGKGGARGRADAQEHCRQVQVGPDQAER